MSERYLNEQAVVLVRGLMDDRGVSQSDLAARLGVSGPALSRALSGRQNLTLNTVQSYMDALGVRARVVVEDGVTRANEGVFR